VLNFIVQSNTEISQENALWSVCGHVVLLSKDLPCEESRKEVVEDSADENTRIRRWMLVNRQCAQSSVTSVCNCF
jgi:hypothetical protein